MGRGGFGLVLGLGLSGCIFDLVGDEQVDGARADGGSGLEVPVFDVGPGLAAHNAVRARAEPPPMPPLVPLDWDDELASTAAAHAARCRFEPVDADGRGENLYVASWAATLEEAVLDWASEIDDYDHEANACVGTCGHYTQIVARDTELVGCGYADCPVVEGLNFGGRLWVCHYDAVGRWVGERPY